MTFKDKCPHCEHYHEKAGKCCFCGASTLDITVKSREQHLEELGDLGEDSEFNT